MKTLCNSSFFTQSYRRHCMAAGMIPPPVCCEACTAKRRHSQGHASGRQAYYQECLLLTSSHKKKKPSSDGDAGGGVHFDSLVSLHVCSLVLLLCCGECWRRPDVLLESPHLDLITPNSPPRQALCHQGIFLHRKWYSICCLGWIARGFTKVSWGGKSRQRRWNILLSFIRFIGKYLA